MCMLQLTQHTASHLVILTMEAVSQGRHAAWSTRHAMNSHAHLGLSAVSIQRPFFNSVILFHSLVLYVQMLKKPHVYIYFSIFTTAPMDPCAGVDCAIGYRCMVDGASGTGYCEPSCDLYNGGCAGDQQCVLKQVECFTTPCPPVVECVQLQGNSNVARKKLLRY